MQLLVLLLPLCTFCFQITNSSPRTDFFDDWSGFNETQHAGKRGGLFFRLNQKSLTYFGDIVVKGLKQYANASEHALPFQPRAVFRFIKNIGVGAKLFIPQEVLDPSEDVESLESRSDVTVQFLLRLGKDDRDYFMVTVVQCKSRIGDVRRGINTFQGVNLENDPCQEILNFSKCLNFDGNYCLDDWGKGCADKKNDTGDTTQLEDAAQLSKSIEILIEQAPHFTTDFRLEKSPEIETDHVLFSIKGGVLYKNVTSSSNSTPPAIILDRLRSSTSDRMFLDILTEHYLNSFFIHIYEHRMISFEERFSMSLLPMVVRFPLESVCWSCHLRIELHLAEPPTTKIDRDGIRVRTTFDVDINASGFLYKATIMHGSVRVNASMGLRIVNGATLVNTTLDSIQVEPGSTGMAHYMPATFRNVVKHWIEERIWPSLRLALMKPIEIWDSYETCDIDMANATVEYTNGAAIISADFKLDLSDFLD